MPGGKADTSAMTFFTQAPKLPTEVLSYFAATKEQLKDLALLRRERPLPEPMRQVLSHFHLVKNQQAQLQELLQSLADTDLWPIVVLERSDQEFSQKCLDASLNDFWLTRLNLLRETPRVHQPPIPDFHLCVGYYLFCEAGRHVHPDLSSDFSAEGLELLRIAKTDYYSFDALRTLVTLNCFAIFGHPSVLPSSKPINVLESEIRQLLTENYAWYGAAIHLLTNKVYLNKSLFLIAQRDSLAQKRERLEVIDQAEQTYRIVEAGVLANVSILQAKKLLPYDEETREYGDDASLRNHPELREQLNMRIDFSGTEYASLQHRFEMPYLAAIPQSSNVQPDLNTVTYLM